MAADEEYRGWRVVEGPGTETTDKDEVPPTSEADTTVGPALGEIPEHTGPNAIAGIELFPAEETEER